MHGWENAKGGSQDQVRVQVEYVISVGWLDIIEFDYASPVFQDVRHENPPPGQVRDGRLTYTIGDAPVERVVFTKL